MGRRGGAVGRARAGRPRGRPAHQAGRSDRVFPAHPLCLPGNVVLYLGESDESCGLYYPFTTKGACR